MSTEVVWMTPVALEKLNAELTALTTPSRELTEQENLRLIELKALVRRAEVGSKPDDGLVEPGMRITVQAEGEDAVLEFVLGLRSLLELDPTLDVDVYSPESPLGAAINGLHVGDTAVISAPNGQKRLTILKATPVA